MAYSVMLEKHPAVEDLKAIEAGLATHNAGFVGAPHNHPTRELTVVARDASSRIVGGVNGLLRYGWLYVDAIWVDDSVRGQQLGSRLLTTIEAAAYERGIRRCFLMTSSFQARPFYEKLGYTVWGVNENRPTGHTIYYLKKDPLASDTPDPALEIQDPPVAADLRFVDDHLLAHAEPAAPINIERLVITLRDDVHTVRGGLIGYTFWEWLDLDMMWVDAPLRRKGWGAAMLQLAFRTCLERGIHSAVLEVASFQGCGFFARQGFEEFGTLPERPPGHKAHFMWRRLPSTT